MAGSVFEQIPKRRVGYGALKVCTSILACELLSVPGSSRRSIGYTQEMTPGSKRLDATPRFRRSCGVHSKMRFASGP